MDTDPEYSSKYDFNLVGKKNPFWSEKVNLEHSFHSQRILGLSANSQSHLPHMGGQSLSLIVANLQLNKVPGHPQRSFYPVVFSTISTLFFKQVSLSLQPDFSKCAALPPASAGGRNSSI